MAKDTGLEINVAQLMKSGIGETRRYDIDAMVPSVEGETKLTQPIQGEVRFTRTKQGILVQGHFKTEVEATCDRCLELFTTPVEFDIEEEYVPTTDVNTGKWLTIEEDVDPAVLINDMHILDLEEVMRQGIILGLPMHAVCRADCLGLCPYCGKNLNEGPCDCDTSEVDPRWEGLRELL